MISNNFPRKKAPGVLAASVLQSFKRYESGKAPNDAVETSMFKKFNRLSPNSKELMRKSISSLTKSRSGSLRNALPMTFLKTNNTINKKQFEKAFIAELKRTISYVAFEKDVPDLQERPGKVRLTVIEGDDVYPNQVHIFKIGNIRTNDFIPYLQKGDYLPEEIQQTCTLREKNGRTEWDCKNNTEPCDGYSIDGVCLAVPAYQAGTSVKLTGSNYFNINAKVELKRKNVAMQPILVEAFVYGDTSTPKTEIKRGREILINDNRVKDTIHFTIPRSLAPGIYEMRVIVPNNSNVTGPGIFDIMYSNIQFIEVLPATATRYRIAGERIYARDETGSTNIGSDEVGLKFISIPIYTDFSLGDPVSKKYRFDDFDTGEVRNINDVIFSHTKSIAGVIISTIGHEIDGNGAYNNEINDWTDVFVDLVTEQWKYVTGSAAIMSVIKQLSGVGFYGYIAIALGILIVTAIDFIVSFWSTPDLIIEDIISLSVADLGRLTSVNYPAPTANSGNVIYTTPGSIKVTIFMNEKRPNQYTEERGYKSEKERSWYNVRLRYNRIS